MTYTERLTPSAGVFLAWALLIPGGLLVFLPVSIWTAIAAAIVFYASACAALLLLAPRVSVEDGEFRAGRAHIPVSVIAGASAHRGADATAERGPRLDARAYLCIRGWIDPVVRVELADPTDPTPYWIVSTRHPEDLIAALDAARTPA
ncbi:DUF3093 domain-containing protein [Herbiconiux sp. L3-i23]|uniref:DUF3093 domain-containing protein n=1 Tax=Herbiconiux sp. L3-i23 TaxID=2905871 RepID=UPI002061BB13|nr:DUF3093 domain-containing protein [Herbiconiux sp. L3-i23]BDI22851.1 hypothetical protein L3i23_16270 [Herbiconiux sp. L3-i23]